MIGLGKKLCGQTKANNANSTLWHKTLDIVRIVLLSLFQLLAKESDIPS